MFKSPRHNKIVNTALAIPLLSILAAPLQADDSIELDIGGFIRVDAGLGDRYDEINGDDRIGVSKAALAVTASYQNIQSVFVIGTEASSTLSQSGTAVDDGDVDIEAPSAPRAGKQAEQPKAATIVPPDPIFSTILANIQLSLNS